MRSSFVAIGLLALVALVEISSAHQGGPLPGAATAQAAQDRHGTSASASVGSTQPHVVVPDYYHQPVHAVHHPTYYTSDSDSDDEDYYRRAHRVHGGHSAGHLGGHLGGHLDGHLGGHLGGHVGGLVGGHVGGSLDGHLSGGYHKYGRVKHGKHYAHPSGSYYPVSHHHHQPAHHLGPVGYYPTPVVHGDVHAEQLPCKLPKCNITVKSNNYLQNAPATVKPEPRRRHRYSLFKRSGRNHVDLNASNPVVIQE